MSLICWTISSYPVISKISLSFVAFGDDSSMVTVYEKNLGDTIITWNKYLKGNIILGSRESVLSSLHIGLHTGDAKYRI